MALDTPQVAAEDTTPAVAEESAAAPPPSIGVHDMTRQELREWKDTGKVPERTPADPTADAATAQPGDQAVSTEALSKADPASVKPQQKSGEKPKLSAKERKAEVDAEVRELNESLRIRAELRKQLAASEPRPKQDAKVEPSSTAKETPKEAYSRLAKDPEAPKISSFEDPDEWGIAMSHFVASRVADEKITAALAAHDERQGVQSEQTRTMADAISVAEERAKADEARDPQWREKVDPGFASIPPSRMLPEGQPPNVMTHIKDLVMFECEYPVSMTLFLSSDEGKAFAAQLVKMPVKAIERAIWEKDASFRTAPADASRAVAPAKVPAKTFTKAPPPAAEMGTKPGGVVDERVAAEGDFKRMWNELDRAEGREVRFIAAR